MKAPNSAEQRVVSGQTRNTHDQIKYLQTTLAICRLSWNTPGVRDVCQAVYDCLAPAMPIERLFCVTRAEMGRIRFLAIIEAGGQKHSPERELGDSELLSQILERGEFLSSHDCGIAHEALGPELKDAKCWVLMPLVSPAKHIFGAVGACSNQYDAFSDMDIDLLKTGAELIMTTMMRTSVIERVISSEREQILDEAAGSTLHNVKNLSGTIPVYVDMIETTLEGDALSKVRSPLSRIKKHAREIQAVTEQKLNEIKSRMSRPALESTDVVALLESARTTRLTDQPDVIFRSEIKSGVPRVLARQRDLFEVFQNILDNGIWSVRNSPQKIVTLRIMPWYDADGRIWAKIEIEDTGCGILESDLKKIWDLTYSTKSPSGGYGLYRAKNVIEALGGYITVQKSQLLVGTTFEIRLLGEISQSSDSLA